MSEQLSTSTFQQVSDWLEENQDEMVKFLLEFGNKQSPAGDEREASDYLYSWMDERFSTEQQIVVEDRPNVVGTIEGTKSSDASSIVFNAHLDTVFGDKSRDEWITGNSHRIYNECWREGDYLYGDDIANDKGPLSAFLWAGHAITQNNIELEGDLYMSGVVGEIGTSQVDEYNGTEYLGKGIGTRHLVTQGGLSADYAVVAETTDYAVGRMECGIASYKITFTDDVEYWPRLNYEDVENPKEDFPGALHDASRAVLALDEWAINYREKHTEEFSHGTNRPSAGVGAFRSGHPTDPAHAPGKAVLYVSAFVPPGRRPKFIHKEIRSVLNDKEIDAKIDLYNFSRGYVTDSEAVEPLVEAIDQAHGAVRGGSPPEPDPAIVSVWRDMNVFNEVGIPAVTFGPARSTEDYSGTNSRCMHITDLIEAAKLYAYIALATCDVDD